MLVLVAQAKNTKNVVERMDKFYIGLMAGTSLDGVDCVIVDENIKLLHTHYQPYPSKLKQKLTKINQTLKLELKEFAELNIEIATIFSQSVKEILLKSKLQKTDVIAIGSHGQTLFHLPQKYSLQIGHPAIIAEQTEIDVVADFRMNDIAAGGEGAPLTPIFHQFIVKEAEANIINLGGIANITKIKNDEIIGFDTGPANTLLDNWIKKHKNVDYDKNGVWAKSGNIDTKLLKKLLADEYFKKSHPKSTGLEYFNLTWLEKHLENEPPDTVQRTLLELTAQTVADNIDNNSSIYLCGGGVHNDFLCERISFLTHQKIQTTEALGVHPDYLEAMAFAYFARETINNRPMKTTNNKQRILGGVWKN